MCMWSIAVLRPFRDSTLCVCIFAVVFLALASPTLTWGFGEDGHRVVAGIAELRLSEKAKRGIRRLLVRDRISDANVAMWADEIKGARPETRPWHFVDIPVETGTFDPATQCKDGSCVIDRINEFNEVLGDTHSSRRERQEALKFLVHFLGDLHQPLHCAERTSGGGKKDRGGNERTVRFPGHRRVTNLHAAWDTLLVEEYMEDLEVINYAAQLNSRITQQEGSDWSRGTVEEWAIETHGAARDHAYKNIPADGPAPRLDTEGYVSPNKAVLEAQLMKAGVRLAKLLNEAFE